MGDASVNMSLDDIIKQNRNSRARQRGTGPRRGARGGGRGAQNRGRSRSQGRSQSRNRSRSASRGRNQSQQRNNNRQRSQSRGRSQSRARSQSRGRAMTPRGRAMTPRGRAGLETHARQLPPLMKRGRFMGRGRGSQNGVQRANIQNGHGTIQSRLGIRSNMEFRNLRNQKPLAMPKRGILRKPGLRTGGVSMGLRSDQMLNTQTQNYIQHKLNRARGNNITNSNIIKTQTFTRSRMNTGSATQFTVSVANDFALKRKAMNRRRNSISGGAASGLGYLDRHSLAHLDTEYDMVMPRGPGSAKSFNSNRSRKSNRSNASSGRGRPFNQRRGVGRNFINKQVLNPRLQMEIAAIQKKPYDPNGSTVPAKGLVAPKGINLTPTPSSTTTSLHERFALM